MTKATLFPAALAAILALTGCVLSNDEQATQTLGGTIRDAVTSRVGGGDDAPQAVDARQVLTADLLEQSGSPVLLLVQRNEDLGTTLIPVGTGADGTVQWRDLTGAGVLMRGGLLVGTRGFGFDLLTVEESGLRQALGQGGGRDIPRTERRLRSDSTVELQELICDVIPTGSERLTFYGQTFNTTVFEENCAGEGGVRQNRYWLGSDGIVRQSEVEVSPEVGVLELSILRN